MANIKSAKKRILVTETKAARNKAIKSKVKTMVKKVEAAIDAKDVAAGYECGVQIENYDDIKVGDVLESYIMEEIKQD